MRLKDGEWGDKRVSYLLVLAIQIKENKRRSQYGEN
jgi:hypothetical protein